MKLSKKILKVAKLIARRLGDCGDFREELNHISTVEEIPALMRRYSKEISANLGVCDPRYYDPSPEEIIEWASKGSLLNSMKAEIFLEILDEITLADMEALYAKHKPNAVNPQQMKLVV